MHGFVRLFNNYFVMYWSGSNIWNYATRNSNYNEMDVGFIATRDVKYI